MNLYKAGTNDIDKLIKLRLDFLRMEKGEFSSAVENDLQTQLQTYFSTHIPLGDFLAMLAEVDGEIASAAFLVLQNRPASPTFMTGINGTLLNVLTYPPYRRKGIARQVIGALVEEGKRLGVSSIDLMATEDGKGLYKTLGFVTPPYTPMRLQL